MFRGAPVRRCVQLRPRFFHQPHEDARVAFGLAQTKSPAVKVQDVQRRRRR
jgi:hypothetical protein